MLICTNKHMKYMYYKDWKMPDVSLFINFTTTQRKQ